MSVLLLNASYQPLQVIALQRAFGLLVAGKAELVDATGRTVRSSGGTEFPVPATLRLRYMVRVPFRAQAPLNIKTLAARDGGRCQFVGCTNRGESIDHLHPRSRGGAHAWTNTVLACTRCNSQKGDRTLDELGWKLKQRPIAPRGSLMLVRQLERSPEWERYAALAA